MCCKNKKVLHVRISGEIYFEFESDITACKSILCEYESICVYLRSFYPEPSVYER